MSITRRSKFAALALGLTLVAGACGSDEKTTSDSTGATEAATETTAAAETTAAESTETTAGEESTETTAGEESTETTAGEEPAGDVAMTVTYDLNPDAVWDDGSPIGVADFECTWLSKVGTVGSIETTGYDQIVSIEEGDAENSIVASFKTIFAPYRGLFDRLVKADMFEDCNDLSEAFDGGIGFSGREWKIESWTTDQLVYVPNEAYWNADKAPQVDKIVVVPMADSDTEIANIKSGVVDFIYPQFYQGIDVALEDPNITVSVTFGGDYEALYFQQLTGPFSDPVYREAFSKSIDRDALFAQIYAPLYAGAEVLTCGPIVPGRYCNDSFTDTYDPEGAIALLEEAGWTKGGDGMWVNPDGEVPEVRWMVNTGNTRREGTQNYLIPLMAAAGFNVKADNCEATPCVFQTRLPALDYDLAMYISTAPPDPAYLTSSFTCAQVPSEENDFKGQNQQGWCNEEASAALEEADKTIDLDARAELIKSALDKMAEDFVLLPLYQFPKSGAYRTDRVGGNVEGQLTNYRAFSNTYEWTDTDGDGQIVIGAEQFPTPDCANPITDCSNSSWYVWTISFPIQPGVFDTTNDSEYAITDLVTAEPVVEVTE